MKTVLTIYNRILSVSRHYGPTDSVLWDIVKVSSRSETTMVKHAIPTSRSRVSKTSIFAICIITTRIRRMGEGNSFNLLVCPRGEGGYLPWPGSKYLPLWPRFLGPRPGQDGGTPRYLPPGQVRSGEGVPQGTYHQLAKVPTPLARSDGGTPRYLHPSQVRVGGGGTPRYLSPPQPRYLPPSQVMMGGTPRYVLPPPPKDLLHGGRHDSCVQAGGFSCFKENVHMVMKNHSLSKRSIFIIWHKKQTLIFMETKKQMTSWRYW